MNFVAAKFENSSLWGLYHQAIYKPTSLKKNWVPKSKTQDFIATFRFFFEFWKNFAENDEFRSREIWKFLIVGSVPSGHI